MVGKGQGRSDAILGCDVRYCCGRLVAYGPVALRIAVACGQYIPVAGPGPGQAFNISRPGLDLSPATIATCY